MPYSNNIDVVTVKGYTLRSMLEHSVSDYDPYHLDPKGWFLQVSGTPIQKNCLEQIQIKYFYFLN